MGTRSRSPTRRLRDVPQPLRAISQGLYFRFCSPQTTVRNVFSWRSGCELILGGLRVTDRADGRQRQWKGSAELAGCMKASLTSTRSTKSYGRTSCRHGSQDDDGSLPLAYVSRRVQSRSMSTRQAASGLPNR